MLASGDDPQAARPANIKASCSGVWGQWGERCFARVDASLALNVFFVSRAPFAPKLPRRASRNHRTQRPGVMGRLVLPMSQQVASHARLRDATDAGNVRSATDE